jgi:hypothetical protein
MAGKNPPIRYREESARLLEEIRIVLPGTGVLLGFQFNAIFSPGFASLSGLFQKVHITSLLLLLMTVILLIAPVAFDRVVKADKELKQFYFFAQRMVTLALIFLALGFSIEVFLVLHIVLVSDFIATLIASIFFLVSIALWFGYTLYTQKKTD